MYAPRKILCPTDFSDHARAALVAAAELLAPDGELVLVHVFDPPYFYGPEATFPETLVADLRADAERALETWRGEARILGIERVVAELRTGAPWAEIVHAATERNADVVVISTHGRTGIEHVLLGSVAEKVVRHAPCAVHVVRGMQSPRP